MKKIFAFIFGVVIAFVAMADDIQPQFPGGNDALAKYISDNMAYPQAAIDNGIEGKVIVDFIVQPDGSIGTIKIMRMIDPDLEAEAIRLVKGMPKWLPGHRDGNPIPMTYSLPIIFTLPEQ